MNDADYISEFEELLKIKKFSRDGKMKMPFDCTYELIAKALKDEYAENIDEKLKRWVSVTHIPYFENAKPVIYYFQAKMLYRDGFYEAAIALSRSVCEMICYDLLSKTSHPFGDLELIEDPMFRVFVKFLAIPKEIDKNAFEKHIIANISEADDKNFIKSSYGLDKTKDVYNFKIANGKNSRNVNRFFTIFEHVNFNDIDNFRNDTYQYLHDVYDIGNIYIHAKKNQNLPKEDATTCLNMLAHILSDIYGVEEIPVGCTIKSGYVDSPDICKGMNFAIECALTPEDAERTYLNLPTQEQIDAMMQTIGQWSGEWKNEAGEHQTGILTFFSSGKDHLNAHLRYKDARNEEKTEPMEIRLYGDYFHLIGFDEKDMKHKKSEHVLFELELFNSQLLIGQSVEQQGKVIFKRIR